MVVMQQNSQLSEGYHVSQRGLLAAQGLEVFFLRISVWLPWWPYILLQNITIHIAEMPSKNSTVQNNMLFSMKLKNFKMTAI